MYYVGVCWLCEAGLVGVRACGNCTRVSLLCDECDSLWIDADIASPPVSTEAEHLPCPYCGASLYDDPAAVAPSHWATRAEIDSCEWLTGAVENGLLPLAQFPLNESSE